MNRRIIQDLSIERKVLSSLLNNKDLIAEFSNILSPDLFTDDDAINRTIYNVIKNFYVNGNDLDEVLIASTVKSYGIQFEKAGYENIEEYVKSLKRIKPSKDVAEQFIKRLYTIKVSNTIVDRLVECHDYVKTHYGNADTSDIINQTHSIFSNVTNLYDFDDEPEDITYNINSLIKDRIDNPQQEIGLKTPFPIFNNYFGGLRDGEVYAFVARPKHGKTTWLAYFSAEIAALNGVKCLYLDTEMKTVDIKFRMASAYTGISMWNLESGNVSEEEYKILSEKMPEIKKRLRKKVFHKHCVGKTTDQIISIIRRWILKNVKDGEKFFIVYDYLKMTGEKTSDHNKEYQIIGEKVNALKSLAEEFKFPLLTACQLNRDAERGNDDSSAIAASDRLQWFASFVAILRRKRSEEVEEYGENIGSHSLIPLATRFQGKQAVGHTFKTIMPILKKSDDNKKRAYKVVDFFINYDIDNFKVKEMSTSDDVAQTMRNQYRLAKAEESKNANF